MDIFSKNNPNRIFYIMFSVILALCLVCVAGLVVLNNVKAQELPKNDETTKSSIIDSGLYDSVILKETADAGMSYQNKIVFVGESTTHHLIASESLPGGRDTKQVWTPTSGTLTFGNDILQNTILFPQTKTEITIAEAAAIAKPEIMILTFALNRHDDDKEFFVRNYTKLINKIKEASPSTKIILQSIFPVTTQYGLENPRNTNAKIDIMNEWIVEIADDCGCKYLNTASVLKDSTGALIKGYNEYHNDGYHIWKEGYVAVLKYIRTHAYLN